jgi:hypothetical protein
MLTASPITRQTVGKTFSVAISSLGVGAMLQLGIIGWAFATRPVSPVSNMTAMNTAAVLRLSTPPVDVQPSPDLTSMPLLTGTSTPGPSVPAKPTPVPQTVPLAEPTNRFEEVMLQAKQLRDRGDMSTAITKYREAGTMDPRNPMPIAELAAAYEKMGSAERAAEQWRKIYEMGDAAGVYYSLAEAKLKAAQALEVKGATAAMPAAQVDTSAAVDGIAAGATLGLLPGRAEEETDDSVAKRFTLHIPIKARPKTKMEVRDLVIHVLFYDLVEGQNVVQTSANVNSRWVTPPADWTESDTEELAVEYHLPKPEAKAAKRENRKYFGYIVRVYYKQQLQAATAEPERLSQQYPPPPTLPKDPDK